MRNEKSMSKSKSKSKSKAQSKGKGKSKARVKRKPETWLAWHWTAYQLRDGRPIPPIGRWLVHKGKRVSLCSSGLHASRSLIDAFFYAPGTLLHRVECTDIAEASKDKFVCRKRKILRSADMGHVLAGWASWCYERSKHILTDYSRQRVRDYLSWVCPKTAIRGVFANGPKAAIREIFANVGASMKEEFEQELIRRFEKIAAPREEKGNLRPRKATKLKK